MTLTKIETVHIGDFEVTQVVVTEDGTTKYTVYCKTEEQVLEVLSNN